MILKATAPGVPDFYQGMELWNLSLVDPDNRRPVDFRERIQILEELKHRDAEDAAGLCVDLCTHWTNGRIKLFTTYKTLEFRRVHAELFARGSYIPLQVEGPRSEIVFAFARVWESTWCIVVAPFQMKSVVSPGESLLTADVWEGTTITLPKGAPETWNHIFVQETAKTLRTGNGETALPVDALLSGFPVALVWGELSGEGDASTGSA